MRPQRATAPTAEVGRLVAAMEALSDDDLMSVRDRIEVLFHRSDPGERAAVDAAKAREAAALHQKQVQQNQKFLSSFYFTKLFIGIL